MAEQAVFTTLCLVTDADGRILVQERKGTGWDGIALPGGHVEPGESFVESARREVLEETGYYMCDPVLCGVKQFQTTSGARYVILLFKAERFTGTLCSSAEGRALWLSRSELSSCSLAPDLTVTLSLFEQPDKSEFYYPPGQTTYQIL